MSRLESASDTELVRRSADGDTTAFRVLFDRKHRIVYAIGRQLLGDRMAAEDVVQESFLALWTHCAEYRQEFPVDSWLRRIATNKAIDLWRSRRRHPAAVADSEFSGAAHTAFSSDREPSGSSAATTTTELAVARDLDAIWVDLSSGLSARQRAAFVLKELQALSTEEVAGVLGCSASTVRSHVAEARKVLRRGLRSRYPEYAGSTGREDRA